MINEIDKKLLKQAIKVLRDLNAKYYEDSSKKKPLLEDEKGNTLYLQFSLKKIPKSKSIKKIKMNLPHSLVKDDSEICLIAGDLDKRNHKAEIEPDVLHYKELLKKHDINNISEVVTLRQLRTEYKPYEAKLKLLAAYDVFLNDRKITECLPKVLGRHFFKKRKFPIQITLDTPNLKQQVEKAVSTKVFYLTGFGNSCNSEVAYLDMSDTEISENVIAMAKAVCDVLPGSWDNVMGIYLKTSLSKAIPLYMSYDDPNKVFLKEEKYENTFEIDELSTQPDKLVKVYKDGSVHTVRRKRKCEFDTYDDAANSSEDEEENNMKQDIDEDSSDNVVDVDSNEESTKGKKKSKREKREKNVLVKEIVNSVYSIDNKGEATNSSKDEEVKKIKGDIIIIDEDSSDNFVDADLNEESTKMKRKSKSEKKEKSILEPEVEKSVYNTDSKGETSDISGDLKKRKKKKSTFVQDDIHNLVDTDLNGKTSDISRDLKKKKKKKGTVIHDIIPNLVDTHMNEKITKVEKKSKRDKKEKGLLKRETESSVSSINNKDKRKKRKITETVVR